MKLKFKKQEYQTEAVNAVADCFAGQPPCCGQKDYLHQWGISFEILTTISCGFGSFGER